jgi:hypothetical protein
MSPPHHHKELEEARVSYAHQLSEKDESLKAAWLF